MILVTAATGKLGRRVVEALVRRVGASKVIAGARSTEKAAGLFDPAVTVRAVDYSRPDTLDAALAGVERVLLISGTNFGQRVAEHTAVIEAAKRAGVKQLAYTSLLKGDRSPMRIASEHAGTEAVLRASGVPFTVLRNGWYTENYTDNAEASLAHGAMIGAAGEGRVSVASRDDYAEAAAVALTTPGHEGRTWELAGDTAHTLAEVAAAVARASGRTCAYVDMPEAVYRDTLVKVGLPAVVAEILADADAGLAKGALEDHGGDLRALLGRPTISLADAVNRAFGV